MDSFLTGESLLFFGKHGRELAVRCNCTLHIFYGLFALMRLLRFNLMACTGVSFTLNKTFNLSLFCFQEELKVRHEPRGGRGEAWVLGVGGGGGECIWFIFQTLLATGNGKTKLFH